MLNTQGGRNWGDTPLCVCVCYREKLEEKVCVFLWMWDISLFAGCVLYLCLCSNSRMCMWDFNWNKIPVSDVWCAGTICVHLRMCIDQTNVDSTGYTADILDCLCSAAVSRSTFVLFWRLEGGETQCHPNKVILVWPSWNCAFLVWVQSWSVCRGAINGCFTIIFADQ